MAITVQAQPFMAVRYTDSAEYARARAQAQSIAVGMASDVVVIERTIFGHDIKRTICYADGQSSQL